jgi:hypothetical protein
MKITTLHYAARRPSSGDEMTTFRHAIETAVQLFLPRGSLTKDQLADCLIDVAEELRARPRKSLPNSRRIGGESTLVG